jgi:hypothetical protein
MGTLYKCVQSQSRKELALHLLKDEAGQKGTKAGLVTKQSVAKAETPSRALTSPHTWR